MSGEYLFYIGIVIPTAITIVLFIVFLWCMYRYKSRRKVLTDIYAPHSKGWPNIRDVTPPCSTTYYREPLIYDMSFSHLDAHDPDATTTEYQQSDFASRRQDSDLTADVSSEPSHNDNNGVAATRKPKQRPYSQASTDSDDSGFRSSRSAHYLQKYDRQDAARESQRNSSNPSHDELTQKPGHDHQRCMGHQHSFDELQEHIYNRQHIPSNNQPPGHSTRSVTRPNIRTHPGYHHGQAAVDYHDAPILQGLNDCHRNQCATKYIKCHQNSPEYLPHMRTIGPYRQPGMPYEPGAHCCDVNQSPLAYKSNNIALHNCGAVPSTVTITTSASVHMRESNIPVFSVV